MNWIALGYIACTLCIFIAAIGFWLVRKILNIMRRGV